MKRIILIIIPKIESYIQFCSSLGVELIQQGFTVKLLTSNPKGAKIDNVDIFHLDFPRALNFLHHYRTAIKIRNAVKVINPDIIHAHFSACIFTVSLAIKKDWPYTIATFHGLSFPLVASCWKKSILKKAEIESAKKYSQVSVLTSDDEAEIVHFIPRKNVYCYRSKGIGCEIDIFDPQRFSQTERDNLKSRLSLLESDFVLIYVGRFVEFKGFAIVVRSFLKLLYKYPNMRLLLVGEKDPIHSSGLAIDEELALKESAKVINIGWTSNVAQYLSISNLLLFPSSREGMPVNIMEALAMGVPVITTNVRGCGELVNDRNGWVLNERNEMELTKAIELLYQDRIHLQALSDYALLHREEYDRKRYVAEQVSIYKSILNDTKK